MEQLTVDICLSRGQYLEIYKTFIRQVHTHARTGQSVRFPVNVLKPFVGHEGVRGSFRLFFDSDHRFHHIERVET